MIVLGGACRDLLRLGLLLLLRIRGIITSSRSWGRGPNPRGVPSSVALIATASLLLIFLATRNIGLYPTVFSDEYNYSKWSRLEPLSDAAFPDYLYLWVYNITSISGDGFLTAARALNAIVFVVSVPLLYIFFRRFAAKPISLWMTLLCVFAPFNVYTAFYMPETPYFVMFWGAFPLLIGLDGAARLTAWAVSGILLGILALIKPHALFLIPAVVAFSLWIGPLSSRVSIYRALMTVICAFGTKWAIGYILAGRSGLTTFGRVYGDSLPNAKDISIQFVLMASNFVEGHLIAVCLLYGMPLAAGVYCLVTAASPRDKDPVAKLAFLSLSMLGTLIIVVSVFATVIVGTGASQTAIHMRYFGFIFPALFALSVCRTPVGISHHVRLRKALIALPFVVLMLYGMCTRLAPYTPNFVDSPEVRGMIANEASFVALGLLSLGSLCLWVYSETAGGRAFIYLYAPIYILIATYWVSRDLRQAISPNVFDKAGIFARNYVPSNDAWALVAVGSDLAGLFRTLFYVDNPAASMQFIPPGVPYDPSQAPDDKTMVLVIGDHPLVSNGASQVRVGEYIFVLRNPRMIAFNRPPPIGVHTLGLFPSEPWGTWSSGSLVKIEFPAPLPEKFKLHVLAMALGPNSQEDMIASVGPSVQKFHLAVT